MASCKIGLSNPSRQVIKLFQTLHAGKIINGRKRSHDFPDVDVHASFHGQIYKLNVTFIKKI